MQGYGTGEGGKEEQYVEHAAEEIAQPGHTVESHIENVWQSLEYQAGTCIGLDTGYREDGWEYDETAEYCHEGVYGCHTGGRRHQACLGTEVTGIGAQASHGQRQRIECLSHGTEHGRYGKFGEVGLQQEPQTLIYARHAECTKYQQTYDEQQYGHHHLGTLLYTTLNTAGNDNVRKEQEEGGKQDTEPGIGDKVAKECAIVRILVHEHAAETAIGVV